MKSSLLTILALTALVTSLASTAVAKSSLHSRDFLRKLTNPAGYKVVFGGVESICGTSDLQHVNDYDGSRGQPVEFVSKYEQGVGALAYGKPDSTSSKYCTGTLISENLFLTASHCVDSTILSEFAVFNYQKQRGSEAVAEQEHVKILEVVEETLGGLDFAILRLEGKPGLKYGVTKIRSAHVEDGNVLTIIQHPGGRVKMLDVGRKLTEADGYMHYGDLDTERGSSGAGVLDQEGFVVGVHTNGGCEQDSGFNLGVPITEIIKVSSIVQGLTR